MSDPQYRHMEEELSMNTRNSGSVVTIGPTAPPDPHEPRTGRKERFENAFDFTAGTVRLRMYDR